MEKTFNVIGMKCPHCKANVENALHALEGVSNAEASLESHSVSVAYDADKVSVDAMKEAVEEAGHYRLED